jgi:serine/threonine protein kinase
LEKVVSPDRNRIQGRIILAQGWLAKDVIVKALHRVGRDADLCTLLVTHGALTRERADKVRRETSRQLGFDPPSPQAQTPKKRQRRTTTGTQIEASNPLDKKSQQLVAIRNFVTDSSLFKKAVFNKKRAPSIHGKRFLKYEIIGELNRGAMGVVYRARILDNNQQVAIKFMLANNPSRDQQARFKREVGVLAKLHHPNIVKVVDYGCENGLLFFAMELIEGQNLKQLVDELLRTSNQPPAWSEIAKVLKSIAHALAYCHKKGIVHRDIKPQNIIVERDSKRAVLIDFGLIKKDRNKVGESLASIGQSLTQHGELVGTPAFMSPEQFSPGGNFGDIGTCSDVWGFGATLFYCMSGAPPYNYPSAIEIFRAIMTYDAPRLGQCNSQLPEWLQQLCDACLLRHSMFRPTMPEIVKGLEKGVAPLVDSGSRSDSRSRNRSASLSGEHRRASNKILALFGSAVLLLVSFIISLPFILQSEEKIVQFESVNADQTWTRKSRVQVYGKVNQAESLVRIAGTMVVCDQDGRFSREVELKEGENTIEVEILEGTKKIIENVTIHRDLTSPVIEISGAIRNDTLELKRLILKGHVRDAMPAQIAFGEKTIQLKSDGRFVFAISQSSRAMKVKLKALDQAGNLSERTLTLITPRALIKRKQSLYLLSDFEIWDRASEETQDQAVDEIASRLGPNFRKLAAKEFQCKTLSFRLGRFYHSPTGIEMHLIPGGRFQFGSKLSDKEKELVEELDEKLEAFKASVKSLRQNIIYMEELLAYKKFIRDNREADFKVRLTRLKQLTQILPGALNFLRTATNSKAESAEAEVFSKIQEKPGVIDHFNNNIELVGSLHSSLTPTNIEKIRAQLKTSEHSVLRLKQIQCKLQEQPKKWTRVAAMLVGQSEVNWQQWKQFAKETRRAKRLKQPASGLSWDDIQSWLKDVGDGLRLPTEIEWEHSCRAGTGNNYFWGSSYDPNYLWILENSGARLHDVHEHQGQFNAFGLLDMLGNVSEWTSDVWVPRYDKTRPLRGEEPRRAVRGGHIGTSYMLCRSASRQGADRRKSKKNRGFRVFRSIPK